MDALIFPLPTPTVVEDNPSIIFATFYYYKFDPFGGLSIGGYVSSLRRREGVYSCVCFVFFCGRRRLG